MAALITDKFTETTNGTRPDPTTVTSTRSAAATTLQCAALTGWPTATAVHFATYRTNAQGEKVAGSQCDWKGIVSGTQITNLTLKAGTDTGNSIGDTVVCMPTAAWADDVTEGLRVEHNIDGTHGAITATSATATGTVQGATVISTGDIQHRSVSLETIRSEMEFDYVASGCVWSGDAYASTRNASMTSGVIYINGRRLTASAVSARSFTASKDTYIDASDNGDGTVLLTYNEVANNAASPALAANNVRVGIIVTGATNIAAAGSVNQGQFDRVLPIVSGVAYTFTDSIGNIICPRDPNRRVIGYRQITANFVSTTSFIHQNVTGLLAPVIVPSSRKVKAHFKPGSGVSSAGAVGSSIGTGIYRGGIAGTGISITAMLTTSGSGVTQVGDAHGVDEPSSSSQSYGATTYGSGTAATSVVATATNPAYIMVELI